MYSLNPDQTFEIRIFKNLEQKQKVTTAYKSSWFAAFMIKVGRYLLN